VACDLVTILPQNRDTATRGAVTYLALWLRALRPIATATDNRLGCPAPVRARSSHDWTARQISQGTFHSRIRPRRVDQGLPVRGLFTSWVVMEPYSLIVALAIGPVVLDTLGLFVSLGTWHTDIRWLRLQDRALNDTRRTMTIVQYRRIKQRVARCHVGDGMQGSPRGLHALKVPCPSQG